MERCFKCGSMRKAKFINNQAVCIYCIGNETKEKNGITCIGTKRSDETKLKMSIAGKGKIAWNKGLTKETDDRVKAYSEKKIGKKRLTFSEEWRQKISKACKGRIAWNKGIPQTKEQNQRNSETSKGSNNGNWQGGISFLPYNLNFNDELKKYIRNRDGNICVNCGGKQDNNKKGKLDVHHIDYDKQNSTEMNLCSLCSTCHGKTNVNREYWTKHFQKYIKSLYKMVA